MDHVKRSAEEAQSVAGSLSSHLPSLLVDLEEAGLSGVISNKMQVRRVLMLLLQAAMSSIHPSISHAIPPAGLTAADSLGLATSPQWARARPAKEPGACVCCDSHCLIPPGLRN